MKFFKRLQINLRLLWQLTPGDLTFRQWLFDPSFGLTRPGQIITDRKKQLPFGVSNVRKHSDVFWLHAALRVLGLDVGFGVYYKCP